MKDSVEKNKWRHVLTVEFENGSILVILPRINSLPFTAENSEAAIQNSFIHNCSREFIHWQNCILRPQYYNFNRFLKHFWVIISGHSKGTQRALWHSSTRDTRASRHLETQALEKHLDTQALKWFGHLSTWNTRGTLFSRLAELYNMMKWPSQSQIILERNILFRARTMYDAFAWTVHTIFSIAHNM